MANLRIVFAICSTLGRARRHHISRHQTQRDKPFSIFTSPKGDLGAIWEHALKRTYTLLISPAIVAELANVLREKFMWHEDDIKARVKRFARIADVITPAIVPTVIEDDPADNYILACAISGKADLIVSGDKRHLLPLKEYEGIPIVRPVDFLRMLGGL